MKFKKLEIYGFKSFADKLEVKFDSGITAIVGPNGCGKSNVADSVRWVLGEQSAKLLRGSKMQDVIFSGTEKRKSLSFCEVQLYFDNKDKQLFPNLDYDEVVISRKLYRSGESEYAINKNSCRLKDITELLRDGGMGREGYSIIGQGRIDELLSAKPEDRRAIFEEAAGISKFKVRKLEAERKLARTQENLLRINDILSEKAKILEPLTKQAETARKWLSLRENLKYYEINSYIYQYDTASEAKRAIKVKLNSISDELNLRQTEYSDANEEYNSIMTEINTLDKKLDGLREEHLKLSVNLERNAGDIKVLNERKQAFIRSSEELTRNNQKLVSDIATAKSLVDNGAEIRKEKVSDLNDTQKILEEKTEQYLELTDRLTAGEDEVQANYIAVLDAADRLAEIKANMGRLVAEREALKDKIEDLSVKIINLNQNIDEGQATLKISNEKINELESRLEELRSDSEKLENENSQITGEIAKLAVMLDKAQTALHTKLGSRKMLTEMRDAMDSFSFCVRNLVADMKKDSEVKKHIRGLVAQIIEVKEGFETAIENALGSSLQNFITNDTDDVKYLIDYIKEKRYGRATFLPISSYKPRHLDSRFDSAIKELAIGKACDFVVYDKAFENIISGLLGDTVIVRDMDMAVRLATKTSYSFRIITLDGDIVSTRGSYSGGSKKADSANIFARERELKKLESEILGLEKEIALYSQKRDELSLRQSECSEHLSNKTEEYNEVKLQLAGLKQDYLKQKSDLDYSLQSLKDFSEESDKAKNRIEKIDDDLGSVEELEQTVTRKKQSAASTNEQKTSEFEKLRSERNLLSDTITELKLKISGLENEIRAVDNDKERLLGSINSMSETLKQNENELLSLKSKTDVIDSEIGEIVELMDDKDSLRLKEIKDIIRNLDTYRQNQQDKVSAIDIKRNELVKNIQKISDLKTSEEYKLERIDVDIQAMEQRIADEYQIDYSGCLALKDEAFEPSKAGAEITRISRQMHALGNINIDAIEQSKVFYSEYVELETQRDDLTKAEADLKNIIGDLSKEMLTRFDTEFKKIRENFIKIFRELFDGGKADLLLLDGENPLDAGIEIVAQPPQKKLQTISLLSGGERALTAIAILFAILKLRPMPFCILDEIEAALDDANATRFAKYLRRFSEETQFIVITHRKPTMELADNLYGVTMEEKGVSKIVSVKLSEAIAAEEVMGS